MTALKDVGNIQKLLENSAFSTSKLWWRSVSDIKPIQIVAFIRRMKGYGFESEAKRNFDVIHREVQQAYLRGEIDYAPLLETYQAPKRLTLGDFRNLLELIPFVRRKAVLFALELKFDLDDVALMKWQDVTPTMKAGMTTTARMILGSLPRYLFTDLLFWELRNGKVSHLYGIKQEIKELICGMEWDEFQAIYDELLPYDERAEFLHE